MAARLMRLARAARSLMRKARAARSLMPKARAARNLMPKARAARHLSLAATLAAAIIGAAFSLQTASLKVEPGIFPKSRGAGGVDALVYLKGSVDLSEASLLAERAPRARAVYRALAESAGASQEALIALLRGSGASFRSFYIENAVLVRGASSDLLQKIAALPEVERISPNASSELKLPKAGRAGLSENAEPVEEFLTVIGADRAWKEFGARGKGIVVAGQDNGVFWEHDALKRQYRGNQGGKVDHNYNWHSAIHESDECPADASAPCDDDGHGTHTMGTMVGSDGSGNQIGVAPEAQWIACRNMRKGVGSVASYLECFEFLLAPYPLGGDPKKDGRPEMAPHIVNNSWGCPDTEGCKGGELLNAVRAMRAAGIFVVASAGNDGGDCMSVFKAPAQYSGDLLSVGAYNRFDHGATWFSSRGPSAWNGGLAPTIVAPGDGIRSAVNSGAGDYGDKEGTSMASPQVAGAIALIWSASPKLIGKIDQTIELLERTAQPLKATQSCGDFPGDKVPNAVFGYGLLDAYAAVKAAREL